MSGEDVDKPEVAKWDPVFTERVKNVFGSIVKRWYRAEVKFGTIA